MVAAIQPVLWLASVMISTTLKPTAASSCWTSLPTFRVLYSPGCKGVCKEANLLRSAAEVLEVLSQCGSDARRYERAATCTAEVTGSIITDTCPNLVGFPSSAIQPYIAGLKDTLGPVTINPKVSLNQGSRTAKCQRADAYIIGAGKPCPAAVSELEGNYEKLPTQATFCGQKIFFDGVDSETLSNGVALALTEATVKKIQLTFSKPDIEMDVEIPTEPPTEDTTTRARTTEAETTTEPENTSSPEKAAASAFTLSITSAAALVGITYLFG